MRPVLLPASLAEALRLLAENPGAVLLAGGTDLLARPLPESARTLVSLQNTPGLDRIEERDGVIRLGALARHADLLAHPLIRDRVPVLAQALRVLGSPLIRNMGTLGGNLCTASPAGDCLPPLLALGAEVELASPAGTRRLALADFLLGPGRTAMQPGEILTAVAFPAPDAFRVQHFEKVGRRDALAVAVVSLAALLRFAPDGRITEARLALGGVAPMVLRCPEAEACLVGRRPTLAALRRAAALVRRAASPISDLRASAAYRREVAGNLLLRLAVPHTPTKEIP